MAFFLNRIESKNPDINAVVHLRSESALKEARSRDLIIQAEREKNAKTMNENMSFSTLSPFFGVPTVIKECMEYKGMPYSAGIYGRRRIMGTQHATAIHRLERLGGFVILGSTNISEACMWFEVI